MIILDTNVVSEPMKPNGNPAVRDWLDRQAAMAYAPLVCRARAAGCLVSAADGQIGAIANAHGFAVATRDTAPFLATGVLVINPWGS